jgi:COP9 signalosome complex subunit 5
MQDQVETLKSWVLCKEKLLEVGRYNKFADAFYVMDAFGLPVEGTETRVNAGADANEYMIDHIEVSQKCGRLENICGWYHSHPGYGCWLSGIDVGTQMLYQKHQEPFVAIVIDPHRTISAGRVELSCFRTFPEDYVKKDHSDDFENVPLEKIEDFGVHANKYCKIEHSFFKSKLDTSLLEHLWN